MRQPGSSTGAAVARRRTKAGQIRLLGARAIQRCGASICCSLVFAGCAIYADRDDRNRGDGWVRYAYDPPSQQEHYCAWYGDERNGVLYFGQSAFWSAMRSSGGEPTADMATAGPVAIGRFDLHTETPQPRLEVGSEGDRSGVWDVLAHPSGRIFFTTFFEPAGIANPQTGHVERLVELGEGLNELELGPGDSMLASRYSPTPGSASGSVVVFDANGAQLRELPLAGPAGYRVAPKTVAYNRLRDEIWVTTDMLPSNPGDPPLHHTLVLHGDGRELRRITDREIQFVAFSLDGTGYRAAASGRELALFVTAPGEDGIGHKLLLDDQFENEFDFVQDIQFSHDGRAVVTRWSGRVHIVHPALAAAAAERSSQASTRRVPGIQLPTIDDGGLYYSAFLVGDRICATLCSEVAVVCMDAPS